MSANWMWVLVALAAAAHALRWVPGRASLRQLKIPAVFALLYVLYAAALGRGGFTALVLSLLIVEVLLQLSRRRWTEDAGGKDTHANRRR